MSTEVKEHPILFKDEMVRAILDGRKTQTRRIISKRNSDHGGLWDRLEFDEAKLPQGAMPIIVDNGYLHVPFRPHPEDCQDGEWWMRTRVYPTWEVGDRLWVRETWGYFGGDEYLYQRCQGAVGYRATHLPLSPVHGGKWRPSIVMPRWACRIILEVTEVRVQRLNEITNEDAIAEGIEPIPGKPGLWRRYDKICNQTSQPIKSFKNLWDSINAARGFGYFDKPWVWAISFKRCGV